jgi:hypothetical protein
VKERKKRNGEGKLRLFRFGFGGEIEIEELEKIIVAEVHK